MNIFVLEKSSVARCNKCELLSRYYTIVAPRVIRPNTEFHVAVSTVNVGQPTTVKVDVGGKQDSGGSFRISQFVTVSPYENRILKLEVSMTIYMVRFISWRYTNGCHSWGSEQVKCGMRVIH